MSPPLGSIRSGRVLTIASLRPASRPQVFTNSAPSGSTRSARDLLRWLGAGLCGGNLCWIAICACSGRSLNTVSSSMAGCLASATYTAMVLAVVERCLQSQPTTRGDAARKVITAGRQGRLSEVVHPDPKCRGERWPVLGVLRVRLRARGQCSCCHRCISALPRDNLNSQIAEKPLRSSQPGLHKTVRDLDPYSQAARGSETSLGARLRGPASSPARPNLDLAARIAPRQ
jgi:hypothetical protein